MSSAMLEAIVFDFDGVILESADIKTVAFVELYAEYGPDVTRRVREHHLENLGISRFKKFEWIAQHILGQPIDDAECKALGERFSALALAKVLAAPFVPCAQQALDQLRIPMFVASGTPHAELEMIINRRGLGPHFREVHGSPAEKPAILRGIIARHGFAAERVLMVGDGLSDHDAAVSAGTCFLARDTPELHDEWTRRGVRRVSDLKGLAELATSW